ncbi:unnamed protein product [Darwinula stevensoni]|uniref:Spaetzle domain-containing protein n=1 Tax=Darwinula stevensoni TaxID=69355 RepID=A0A7R9AC05_9CRUS|nr:unnamed protein product [Darwinula stevensoni]CAG0899942.1 unnamed protein product [Darwinula stevensoni]
MLAAVLASEARGQRRRHRPDEGKSLNPLLTPISQKGALRDFHQRHPVPPGVGVSVPSPEYETRDVPRPSLRPPYTQAHSPSSTLGPLYDGGGPSTNHIPGHRGRGHQAKVKLGLGNRPHPQRPPPPPPPPSHPHPHLGGGGGGSYQGKGPHEVPHCARNLTYSFCLDDYEYPTYEMKGAIENHAEKFNEIYADVADQHTKDTVETITYIDDETYLCPSDVLFVRPKRARNVEGKWKIVVNLEEGYHSFTQTVRTEKCLETVRGKYCPLVPECYESKCIQKSIYHRFLTYDPYDEYFPFALDIFQLPGSCSCYVGEYLSGHEDPHKGNQ